MRAEGRCIWVFDLATGKERGRWTLPDVKSVRPGLSPVDELLVLPGDRRVLTTLEDGTALVWDLNPLPPPRLSEKYGEPELRGWWDDLAGNDARRAYSAGWRLSEAPADDVVRFLRDRLKPAVALDADEVAKLIADLASSKFAAREAASRRLAELGSEVIPALENALKTSHSAEVRARLQKLLEKQSDPVPPPEVLRAVRAVAVLERLGTADARRLLEDLAGGSVDSPQTRAAKLALGRLAARP